MRGDQFLFRRCDHAFFSKVRSFFFSQITKMAIALYLEDAIALP
ncbi:MULTISPECIES: hypothetical protein [Planktothrix]|nr:MULTISPECIES: hypothetical protein [Planktothrix]